MIRIVDYGVGNIQAFITIFKNLGIQAQRASTPNDLTDATRLILPGVGHFDHAMQRFNDSGLRTSIEELVMHKHVPILGVCVGMQMLAESSDEGTLSGLNWISGRVRSFASQLTSLRLPMPHMGWNDVRPRTQSNLFLKGFDEEAQFYFLHSYFFDVLDERDIVATTQYGFEFPAVVSRGNIYGVQCHPEKSHHWGTRLLKNFAEL
jgi:imidazole glycerol-phosphate synthase subunit HisH